MSELPSPRRESGVTSRRTANDANKFPRDPNAPANTGDPNARGNADADTLPKDTPKQQNDVGRVP